MVSSNLDKGIAFQIRATRSARGWTQSQLAKETGMTPNNVSRIESEDYGKQTLTSLKRVAEALDVALVVRFVPFSQYIDWLSATPFLDEGIRPAALAVPGFEEEESKGSCEMQYSYWRVTTPGTSASIPETPKLTENGLYQQKFVAPVPIVTTERRAA